MKNIEIYTKNNCPYCVKAKALLDRKGVKYKEINVGDNPKLRADLVEKAAGRKTVPQIFIDDMHIGGCDDLYEKEVLGELDGLLGL